MAPFSQATDFNTASGDTLSPLLAHLKHFILGLSRLAPSLSTDLIINWIYKTIRERLGASLRPLRSRHLINMQKREIGVLRGLGTRLRLRSMLRSLGLINPPFCGDKFFTEKR
jgi:hypothetical protein